MTDPNREGAEFAVARFMDEIVREARADERRRIADQVRRNCTLPSARDSEGRIVRHHRDDTIAAVADWIENPPEWVTGPDVREESNG